MRVRKKPWAAQELLDNTLVINDAPEKKGKWKEYFGNDHPIYVEIGCGKGGFLRKNAEASGFLPDGRIAPVMMKK